MTVENEPAAARLLDVSLRRGWKVRLDFKSSIMFRCCSRLQNGRRLVLRKAASSLFELSTISLVVYQDSYR